MFATGTMIVEFHKAVRIRKEVVSNKAITKQVSVGMLLRPEASMRNLQYYAGLGRSK